MQTAKNTEQLLHISLCGRHLPFQSESNTHILSSATDNCHKFQLTFCQRSLEMTLILSFLQASACHDSSRKYLEPSTMLDMRGNEQKQGNRFLLGESNHDLMAHLDNWKAMITCCINRLVKAEDTNKLGT